MPQSQYWPFNNKIDRGHFGEASLLQKQLGDMEGEVKEIQMELAAIKKDRQELHNLKQSKGSEPDDDNGDPTSNQFPPLHNEDRYNSNRYAEIAKLREELIRAKKAADEEKIQREKYEAKLKDLELKLNNICSAGKINETKHSNSEVAAMKIQVRDMKEETEELKMLLAEKNEQLQEYRVKYLQAQQQVEELKRQLDVIEIDNKQVSDQIQIEIQRMKMQFQEKLQDLAPLPDLLKGAQIQLQEAKQLQKLAEDSSQQLSNELHRVKEKLVAAVNNLNHEKAEKIKILDDNRDIQMALVEKQNEIDECCKNIDEYKCNILRFQEKLSQQEIRFGEKSSECAKLLKDLEELREESDRSLSRCKERSDSMRRYLQTQISELERQLIQSRAHCRAYQKDRDEIRQRMQMQINSLQENLELVEIKLRALQNQVTSLKSSYTYLMSEEDENRNDFGIITQAT